MTILSADTLLNVLDLIADGATVVETTTAIGGAPKSKIIFAWLADSEAAGEFDPPPDPDSQWCLEWSGSLDWFHVHYRTAVADGKNMRAIRKSPIRADLEARLAAKRASAKPAPKENTPQPPRMVVDHVRQPPVIETQPPAPPPRPAYAYRRAPPIDGTQGLNGPPLEGRFSVAAYRPKSKRERQSGLPEVTEQGIRWN